MNGNQRLIDADTDLDRALERHRALCLELAALIDADTDWSEPGPVLLSSRHSGYPAIPVAPTVHRLPPDRQAF